MAVLTNVDAQFTVGEALFFSRSQAESFGVVFEDDGETAYFYACELGDEGKPGPVLDALQIYNCDQVTDRHKPSRVQIGWNEAGSAAVLLIKGNPHAVFDFAGKRAACRTGFPAASGKFAKSHDWDQNLTELFR